MDKQKVAIIGVAGSVILAILGAIFHADFKAAICSPESAPAAQVAK